MSASPTTAAVQSQKRPLEEPSSPSGPGDQPDAKRPALDKVIKEVKENAAEEEPASIAKPASDPPASEPPKLEETSTTEQNGTEAIQAIPTSDTTSGPSKGQNAAGHQDETGWLHMRAIISSAEAATVIGKGGENVTLIRRLSGAKCTVSDYTRGAVERILTVSGLVDAVAKVGFVFIFLTAPRSFP